MSIHHCTVWADIDIDSAVIACNLIRVVSRFHGKWEADVGMHSVGESAIYMHNERD